MQVWFCEGYSYTYSFATPLVNSRFWILATGIVLSAVIADLVRLHIPPGSLQTSRIEQYYGYASMTLLYIALLTSSLTKVLAHLPLLAGLFTPAEVLERWLSITLCCTCSSRSSANWMASPACVILTAKDTVSVLLGMLATLILLVFAATFFHWIIEVMHFKN